MTTRTVTAGPLRYTLAVEEPVPESRSFWAVVQGRALDELTGEAPTAAARISSSVPGVAPRSAPGGLVGLLGYPAEVFPELDAQDYVVPFTVHAEGYLPFAGEAALGPQADFPDGFVPAALGDLPLRREPVVVTGRVLRRVNGVRMPVVGATVEVTEIWPVVPPADGSVAPGSPTFMSLRPPLHFARRADVGPASGRLRRREMTAVIGEDKRLEGAAEAGATQLRATDRLGLAAGQVLHLDEDAAIEELVVIDAVVTAAAPELPAIVTLTHPLAYRHREGARVRRMTPQAPGTFRPFAREAIAGDRCVFLDSLAGVAAAQVVEVSGGAPPAEFHWVGRFTASSDAAGGYRLPPLSRVAQLTLQVTAGPDTTDPLVFVPNYASRENRLDVEF